MTPFTWVLIAFPVYLLVKGRIPAYVAMATSQGAQK